MPAPIHISKDLVAYYFTADVVADRPVAWEVALHTKNPEKGDLWEVEETGYARTSVTFTKYEDAEDRGFWEAENEADVSFPAALEGQDYTVTHYTIRDATSGECLAIAALEVPIPVVEGTIVTFPATYIKVRGI